MEGGAPERRSGLWGAALFGAALATAPPGLLPVLKLFEVSSAYTKALAIEAALALLAGLVAALSYRATTEGRGHWRIVLSVLVFIFAVAATGLWVAFSTPPGSSASGVAFLLALAGAGVACGVQAVIALILWLVPRSVARSRAGSMLDGDTRMLPALVTAVVLHVVFKALAAPLLIGLLCGVGGVIVAARAQRTAALAVLVLSVAIGGVVEMAHWDLARQAPGAPPPPAADE